MNKSYEELAKENAELKQQLEERQKIKFDIYEWLKWLLTPTSKKDVWRIEKEAKRLVVLAKILTVINVVCLIYRLL